MKVEIRLLDVFKAWQRSLYLSSARGYTYRGAAVILSKDFNQKVTRDRVSRAMRKIFGSASLMLQKF